MPAVLLPLALLSAAPSVVPLAAVPFDPAAVRLADGPFREAQQRDAAWLLQLDPARLVAWFRREAGLPQQAQPYGGWESQGVAGHSLGHYLSACAWTYASTGDARFKERIDGLVAELAACQQAIGTGYLAAIPGGKQCFADLAAGRIRSAGFDLNGIWVPWYTLHKLFAGLLDAQALAGSEAALAVARQLADWADRTLAGLTPEQWQTMLACEHGGMNEVLAELWARTGETRYLALSRQFHHRAVLDPLAAWQDKLAGLHANTQIPKAIGCARRYELTGDTTDRVIAETFWQRVVQHHSYVIGGHSDHEHFGPPDRLNDRLSTNTSETCNTYNMLKLTAHRFAWSADPAAAEYAERALWNHILASQNPVDGMTCYYVPLRSGEAKTYSTPFDSFWCCTGTGMENHARYGEQIWFGGDDLWLNQFIASTVTWRAKGVQVTQSTRFPQEPRSRLTVHCPAPTDFTLRLRWPRWCVGYAVQVNGEPVALSGLPGSYVAVRRTWRDGDRVTLELPLALRCEAMPDNADRLAVLYGPLVLAADLGNSSDPRPELLPALVSEQGDPAGWLQPTGEPLTWRSGPTARPRELTWRPFYATHGVRYAVYLDRFTPAQWAAHEAAWRAEQERLRELEARTADRLRIGEMQPERDHNLQGERTSAGDFGGRKWRHAVDGGWFSFELAVPDGPAELLLTYWGSDSGGREFEVWLNDRLLGTQILNNQQPGQFFDVVYKIPPDFARGNRRVTVKLQAKPGRLAGGLFGARMVKPQ
ncbi:MAG: glycoside hydrolase family 127 protein [Fimbriimonadaceae bacterium]|nr:glycoside hydrolase family 127 protein [Fimbriimonadaceae bacterium]